ncbi:hypothetical protein HY625_02720 [Candidatus Uhrbacteria bacterium]|nr:hypothetical protein [Candidatus Uhrbacteria bacterium]
MNCVTFSTAMTENNVVQLLEHMGRCYRRSYVPMKQSRVESIRALLVHELSSASQELEVADASVAVRMPIFSFPSFAEFFHLNLNVLRPVLAVLVLGVFGVGSLMRVASASLPGDTLYTVKLAKEQAQVLLTRDDSDRAKLSVQFAIERADEVKRVVASSEPREQKAMRLAVATTGLTAQVTQATDALVASQNKKEFVAVMEEGAGQIVTLLHDAKNEAAKGNGIVSKEVDKALSAMTETQELVQIAAHPPTVLAVSVPVQRADSNAVQAAPNEKSFTPVSVTTAKHPIGQSAALIYPAQSVFSLPMAESVGRELGGDLPIAGSIQSAP